MSKGRILLVDDEELILKTLSRDLVSEGFEVTTRAFGAEAVKLLATSRFDVLVTDLVMEAMNGIAVLAEARRLDSELSVIILTGHGDMESAIEALRLGADDYLIKPCDFEELLIRIGRCQERREMRRKIRLYENILPICCGCKKIRDDEGKEHGKGEWMTADVYIERKTDVRLSHGYCPDCARKALEEIENGI